MWWKSTLVMFTAAAMTQGCASAFNTRRAQETSIPELREVAGTDTTNALWYKGSDEDFHYFARGAPPITWPAAFKTRRDDLFLEKTFEVGGGKSYVVWPSLLKDKPPEKDSD